MATLTWPHISDLHTDESGVAALDLERAGSEQMVALCRERLAGRDSRVAFHCGFLQDYRPASRHDAVICSQVLMHNLDDESFRRAVEVMSDCAETSFLFEHVDTDSQTSSQTCARGEQELLSHFRDYRVGRRQEHRLFDDRLVFLKLLRVS